VKDKLAAFDRRVIWMFGGFVAMRHAFLAAAAVTALAASSAFATPLGDAKSGLAAFDKGDNLTAIRLFTAAINSHQLARRDQELAYVKRGEAYLAAHQEKSALADANHALDLDPGDAEAAATRDRATALLAPPPAPPVAPPPAPAAAPAVAESASDVAKAEYAASEAAYEAKKKATEDAYARQMADYDSQVKAESDRHAAELAAWQKDVADCKAGVLSKCAGKAPVADADPKPAKPPAAKPVETAKAAPAPKPEKVAAKAPAKPVKKPAPQSTPDRPAIY
jgi:hypothetical protein